MTCHSYTWQLHAKDSLTVSPCSHALMLRVWLCVVSLQAKRERAAKPTCQPWLQTPKIPPTGQTCRWMNQDCSVQLCHTPGPTGRRENQRRECKKKSNFKIIDLCLLKCSSRNRLCVFATQKWLYIDIIITYGAMAALQLGKARAQVYVNMIRLCVTFIGKLENAS